jgi:LysR family transcriptional activator of nhaA
MDWLNYHHLLYFWTVVREGGVSRGAEKLRLAQPTVSAQIKRLEDSLGDQLFERQGRRLVLTEVGRLVYRYADEIFGIGNELIETLKGRPSAGRPLPLTVGVANAVPKLIVHRLLQPAMSGEQAVHLVCREDSTECSASWRPMPSMS